MQEPSSIWANDLKLRAAASVQPCGGEEGGTTGGGGNGDGGGMPGGGGVEGVNTGDGGMPGGGGGGEGGGDVGAGHTKCTWQKASTPDTNLEVSSQHSFIL